MRIERGRFGSGVNCWLGRMTLKIEKLFRKTFEWEGGGLKESGDSERVNEMISSREN